MIKSKMIPETKEGDFGTMTDLMIFVEENKIPARARIEYAGCGTHRIEFVWEVEDEGSLREYV